MRPAVPQNGIISILKEKGKGRISPLSSGSGCLELFFFSPHKHVLFIPSTSTSADTYFSPSLASLISTPDSLIDCNHRRSLLHLPRMLFLQNSTNITSPFLLLQRLPSSFPRCKSCNGRFCFHAISSAHRLHLQFRFLNFDP